MVSYPDFSDPSFLSEHARSVVDFYRRYAFDANGGYFHSIADDGTVVDRRIRHIVSSTRFVYLFATAYRLFADETYRELADHALQFVVNAHFDPQIDAFHRTIEGEDDRRLVTANASANAEQLRWYCYDAAFALLAGVYATGIGLADGSGLADAAWRVLERDFWEAEHGAYADIVIGPDKIKDPYRGQNANMHVCEACIAAYRETADSRYLDRARVIAHAITKRNTGPTDGKIWEHFDSDWTIDWEFNRDDPDNLFHPWGYQPGHHAEWSKLLVEIYQLSGDDNVLERAKYLFDVAFDDGHDLKYDGLMYSIGPDGVPASSDKYYWVQTETIGAAARLYDVTGDDYYMRRYDQLWRYAWDNFIDHTNGGWYRVLDRANRKYSNHKSPPGKAGYHPLNACVTALDVFSPKS